MYMPIITVRNLSDLGLKSTSPFCLWSIRSSVLPGFSSMDLVADMVMALGYRAFDELLESIVLDCTHLVFQDFVLIIHLVGSDIAASVKKVRDIAGV